MCVTVTCESMCVLCIVNKQGSCRPSSTIKNAEIARPDTVTGVRTPAPPLVCVSLRNILPFHLST